MPNDLADDLRPPVVARRIAPLATAIGVIVAATVGLVLARIDVPAPSQPAVSSINTTAPTTH